MFVSSPRILYPAISGANEVFHFSDGESRWLLWRHRYRGDRADSSPPPTLDAPSLLLPQGTGGIVRSVSHAGSRAAGVRCGFAGPADVLVAGTLSRQGA